MIEVRWKYIVVPLLIGIFGIVLVVPFNQLSQLNTPKLYLEPWYLAILVGASYILISITTLIVASSESRRKVTAIKYIYTLVIMFFFWYILFNLIGIYALPAIMAVINLFYGMYTLHKIRKATISGSYLFWLYIVFLGYVTYLSICLAAIN